MMMFGRGWFAGGACPMGGGLWGGRMMFGLFLIAVAVILLIVRGTGVFGNRSKDDQVLDDLKHRYANGELSEEEYLRKKEVLRKP